MRDLLLVLPLALLATSGCLSSSSPRLPAVDGPPGPANSIEVTATACPVDTGAGLPAIDPLWYCHNASFTHEQGVAGYLIELTFESTQADTRDWIVRVGRNQGEEPSGFDGTVLPGDQRFEEVARAWGASPVRLTLGAEDLAAGVTYDIWVAPDPEGPMVLVLQDQGAVVRVASFYGTPVDESYAFAP